jgi:hypothetical protein
MTVTEKDLIIRMIEALAEKARDVGEVDAFNLSRVRGKQEAYTIVIALIRSLPTEATS